MKYYCAYVLVALSVFCFINASLWHGERLKKCIDVNNDTKPVSLAQQLGLAVTWPISVGGGAGILFAEILGQEDRAKCTRPKL
jgi:hypothetical protein